MKKTRFTETQIVAILKHKNQGYLPKRSAVNTAFQKLLSTIGRVVMGVWKPQM
jgi:hypothetical protein